MKYYVMICGCHEVSFFKENSNKAINVMDRWLRLFWDRYKDWININHPNSIANASANSWYREASVTLYEYSIDEIGVIQINNKLIYNSIIKNYKLPKSFYEK
ncbi:MAG: hypothetical protein WC942_07345 [Clostridia bacterium]